MTTSLERLVDFMSGRNSHAVDRVRQELSDPSHETSRWLTAARTLTLDAMDERALASFELGPREQNAKRTTGPIRWRFLPPARLAAAAGAVAATILARDLVGGRELTAECSARRFLGQLAETTAMNEQLLKLKESISRLDPQGSDQIEKALARLEQIESRVAEDPTAFATAIQRQRYGRLGADGRHSPGPLATNTRPHSTGLSRAEVALGQHRGKPRWRKSQPQVDPARVELILTRLRDLAEQNLPASNKFRQQAAERRDGGTGPRTRRDERPSAFRRR